MQDGTRLRKLPYLIAAVRIVLAPFLFYTYLLEVSFMPLAFFLIATLTDILDGYLARRLDVTSKSSLEAYIDSIADCAFITIAYFAFAIKGIYPIWIPIALIAMFLFFICTSKTNRPVYDPIGKYYGVFLILTIGFTLLLPMALIYNTIFFSFLVYTVILVVYRINFILKLRKNQLSLEEANDFLE